MVRVCTDIVAIVSGRLLSFIVLRLQSLAFSGILQDQLGFASQSSHAVLETSSDLLRIPCIRHELPIRIHESSILCSVHIAFGRDFAVLDLFRGTEIHARRITMDGWHKQSSSTSTTAS